MIRSTPAAGTTAITFGMVPVVDDPETRTRQVDLCAALGRLTGQVVRCHRFPSAESLASAYGAGRVQLIWASPALFVLSKPLAQAIPLVASVRGGRVDYHTAIFVPERSPIAGAEDLRGKRMAWVSRTSAAGYIFPRLALAARGLDPDELFASQALLESYGAVTRAVHDGSADAGATFAVFEGGDPNGGLLHAGFEDVADVGPFRIILADGPIPSDLVAAAPTLPAETRAAIRRGLQAIGADDDAQPLVRALFNAEGFRPVSPSHLDELRNRLR